MIRTIVAVFLALALVACGDSSPGPLAGTWQTNGLMVMKTSFRSGETETMGMIEKVGYKVDGHLTCLTEKSETSMAALTNVHTERVFENELCEHFTANGWSVRTHLKDAKSYSRELALFPEDLIAFVQVTQPKEWANSSNGTTASLRPYSPSALPTS